MATNLADLDFDAVIRAQREKWAKVRDEAQAKLDEANSWLEKFDRLDGKVPEQPSEPPKQPRAPRGSGDTAKEKVYDIILHNPGMKTDDIKERLDAEGVQVGNLNNVLLQLKSDNRIQQSKKRQPWFPVIEAGEDPTRLTDEELPEGV